MPFFFFPFLFLVLCSFSISVFSSISSSFHSRKSFLYFSIFRKFLSSVYFLPFHLPPPPLTHFLLFPPTTLLFYLLTKFDLFKPICISHLFLCCYSAICCFVTILLTLYWQQILLLLQFVSIINPLLATIIVIVAVLYLLLTHLTHFTRITH